MKTTRTQLNEAFSEIECLDRRVIAVIVKNAIVCVDGVWKGFPPVVVDHGISRWGDVSMVLVGQRSTGTVAMEFSKDLDILPVAEARGF